MMKYECRITGTLTVEADDEDSARIKAEMTSENEWSWDSIDIEEE